MILIAPPKGAKELQSYIKWLTISSMDFTILSKDVKSVDMPLLLCGGSDIGKNPERDQLEIKWIKSALENKQPILGICRGMQILNYYFGGTVEDIPTNITEEHRSDRFEDDVDHSNRLSQFHFVVDNYGNTMKVNSRHHQYCSNIAPNFKITHNSIGGGNIPEAISDPDLKIYAVQWHPERMECHDDLQLLNMLR